VVTKGEAVGGDGVRLIATDLDGTIVRSDGTISTRTRDTLSAAEGAGLLVVFVTGRPPRWMQPIAEATGHTGVAICMNGAIVYDMGREVVLEEHPLQPAVAKELVDALRRALPDVTFAVDGTEGLGREPNYRSRFPLPSDAVVAEVEKLVASPVAKLLVRHEGMSPDDFLSAALGLAKDLEGLAEITFSGRDGLLEISAAGISKAFTLERLAAGHGIGPDGVVAFGDAPNDLPMLAWAGHAVAVANAHADVRQVADEITATNDDDGVALVIERLLAAR
jgi:Cof subfamily protein (haloacid dehalogenase superfamily)